MKYFYKENALEMVTLLKKSNENHTGNLYAKYLAAYKTYFGMIRTYENWDQYVFARDVFLQYIDKIDLSVEINRPERVV